MRNRPKLLAVGAAVVAIAAGGAGVALATGGDDASEQVSGAKADRAAEAARELAGGGTVTSVERGDDEGDGAFEVEVRRGDGSQVEVHLDDQLRPLGTEPDDDTGSESEDDD